MVANGWAPESEPSFRGIGCMEAHSVSDAYFPSMFQLESKYFLDIAASKHFKQLVRGTMVHAIHNQGDPRFNI